MTAIKLVFAGTGLVTPPAATAAVSPADVPLPDAVPDLPPDLPEVTTDG